MAESNSLTVPATSSVNSKLDELLREALGIADVRNPAQVAQALVRKYPKTARLIEDEARGVPLGTTAPAVFGGGAALPSVDSIGDREFQRVRRNVENDIVYLHDHLANREWREELIGWREAILAEVEQGAVAARRALDSTQRERLFLAVRKLGDFARLARLVGVASPELMCPYRRLATTLDECANSLRVLAGEALYNAGLSEGGLILQVPLGELRQRRDATVAALRRLNGTDPDGSKWGDVPSGYGELLRRIDAAGQSYLKTYLRNETLVPILDRLVTVASGSDAGGLRAIAATAPVELANLSALVEIGKNLLDVVERDARPYAPLDKFFQWLALFTQAFGDMRNGARLIAVAVPRLMSAEQLDEADWESVRILQDLVQSRAEFARALECFVECCCAKGGRAKALVRFDKLLSMIDHGIDAWLNGNGDRVDGWSAGEVGAAGVAYGIVGTLASVLNSAVNMTPSLTPDVRPEVVAAEVRDLIDAAVSLFEGFVTPACVRREAPRSLGEQLTNAALKGDSAASGTDPQSARKQAFRDLGSLMTGATNGQSWIPAETYGGAIVQALMGELISEDEFQVLQRSLSSACRGAPSTTLLVRSMFASPFWGVHGTAGEIGSSSESDATNEWWILFLKPSGMVSAMRRGDALGASPNPARVTFIEQANVGRRAAKAAERSASAMARAIPEGGDAALSVAVAFGKAAEQFAALQETLATIAAAGVAVRSAPPLGGAVEALAVVDGRLPEDIRSAVAILGSETRTAATWLLGEAGSAPTADAVGLNFQKVRSAIEALRTAFGGAPLHVEGQARVGLFDAQVISYLLDSSEAFAVVLEKYTQTSAKWLDLRVRFTRFEATVTYAHSLYQSPTA